MDNLEIRMQPNGMIKIILPEGEVYEIPTYESGVQKPEEEILENEN